MKIWMIAQSESWWDLSFNKSEAGKLIIIFGNEKDDVTSEFFFNIEVHLKQGSRATPGRRLHFTCLWWMGCDMHKRGSEDYWNKEDR